MTASVHEIMGTAEIMLVFHSFKNAFSTIAYKIIKGCILRRDILKMDAALI